LHTIEHTTVKIAYVRGTPNFQWYYQNFGKYVEFALRSILNFSRLFFWEGEGGRNIPEILQKVSPKVSPTFLAKFHELKISTKPQHSVHCYY